MKSENLLAYITIGLMVVVILLVVTQKTRDVGDIIVNEAEDRNTISVSDSYTMDVEPDLVEIYLNIETKGKTAIEAQQFNTKESDDVIGALKQEGIKNQDIETIGYYLNPEYNWESGTGVLVGYTQTHSIKVTTTRLDKVGTLIDVTTKAGVDRISSISYTLSKEKTQEVMSQALDKAAEKAKKKAQALTNSLGVKLGKLVTVSESNVQYQPYVRYDVATAEKAGGGMPAPTIMPENVGVSAYISLVYEIE